MFKNIRPIVIILVWFILINLISLILLNRFNLMPDDSFSWIDPSLTFQQKSWNIFTIHNRWDSWYYLNIADSGYKYLGENSLSNIVFFPLFPALVGLLNKILFFITDLRIIGWIVSTTSTFLAGILLYRFTERFYKLSNPSIALLAMLLFPTAHILNNSYPESTYLFLSLLAISLGFSKKYSRAALVTYFAALARPNGFLIAIPLVVQYYIDNRKEEKALSWFTNLGKLIIAPIAALVTYLGFLQVKFGDAMLFFDTQAQWGRSEGIDIVNFSRLFNNPAASANTSLDLFMIISILALGVMVIRRVSLSLGLYTLVVPLFSLATGTIISINRHGLILFPIFILIGTVKNEFTRLVYFCISITLLVIYTMLHVNHYWAG